MDLFAVFFDKRKYVARNVIVATATITRGMMILSLFDFFGGVESDFGIDKFSSSETDVLSSTAGETAVSGSFSQFGQTLLSSGICVPHLEQNFMFDYSLQF